MLLGMSKIPIEICQGFSQFLQALVCVCVTEWR